VECFEGLSFIGLWRPELFAHATGSRAKHSKSNRAENCTDHALREFAAAIQLEHAASYAEAEVFQLTSAGPEPKEAGRIPIKGAQSFEYTMPPYSVSTFPARLPRDM